MGINYAIQDAVVAANLLAKPLREGRVAVGDLAFVQRQREWPTRIVQAVQNLAQQRVLNEAIRVKKGFKLPWFVRFKWVRHLALRFFAIGLVRVRLEE